MVAVLAKDLPRLFGAIASRPKSASLTAGIEEDAGFEALARIGAREEKQMKIRSKVAGLAAMVALAATPALAVEVSKSVEVAAKPDAVWKMIGSFCDIQTWHPAATKCELKDEGGKSVRTITLPDGAALVEEQTARDDDKMSYSYTILDGPLPVANYQSTISVSGSGDGSTISWSGTFEAKGASDEKASEVIGGIYDAGLASLKDKAGAM